MEIKLSQKYSKNNKKVVVNDLENITKYQFCGVFNGFSVQISDPEQIQILNEMFQFGINCTTSPSSNQLNCILEEAFFLKYALQCLSIQDIDCNINLNEDTILWKTFCDLQSNFIQNYVAYHYFRMKNWIVKSAFKFGADFLLYKNGPKFYHASFVVLVDVLNISNMERNNQICANDFNINSVIGLNRLSEANGKDLLICQVIWPKDLTVENAKASPMCIKDFKVNVILFKRWVPEKERQSNREL